jgi:LEA14-like dessication related protein
MEDAMSKLIFLLATCLMATGCASLNIQQPTAEVTGMSVQNVDANGFTMNFGVDVKNPNSVALPLTSADYKVSLSGTNVLDGKANLQGSLPANGTKSITLPVTMTYENLLAAEKGIVASGGNVPYTLDAGLSFDTGTPLIGTLRVPLQYSGTLPLKSIVNNPQALLQNPAAQKLAREILGGVFGG